MDKGNFSIAQVEEGIVLTRARLLDQDQIMLTHEDVMLFLSSLPQEDEMNMALVLEQRGYVVIPPNKEKDF